MSKKLWDKGAKTNAQMHSFTVGNDPELDLSLIRADVVASGAHAQMLQSIGVLSDEELKALLAELKKILALHEKGKFEIPHELEDGHTAIENHLTKQVGEAGKKIHTGRSRNDQVLTAMRLFMRQEIIDLIGAISGVTKAIYVRCHESGELPLPGYTHFQPAMPASVGMWLQAFAEALIEMIRDGLSLHDRINSNPLGAASGFGVPLPLDREMTARLLGFARVQRNPIDVQNSRGRYELKFVRWCCDIAGIIEKMAWDIVLYTSREYGFVSLPEELTTGSSIMPQKKNPDVVELLRGRAAKVRGAASELLWVSAKLPSNYHRDLQYTKEPVIRAAINIGECLAMLETVVKSLRFNSERLQAAMSDDLYATYDAYRQVKEGVPFREAYVATAARAARGEIKRSDHEREFDSIAVTAIKELKAGEEELKQLQEPITRWQKLEEEVIEWALK